MTDNDLNESILSSRALHTKSFVNFRRYYAGQVRLNGYDAVTNPEGFIDLGTAENKLVEDIVHQRLLEPDCQQVERYMHYYFEYHGVKAFRETIAAFLQKRLKSKHILDPEQIVVTSGVGSALDLMSYALADPGDCFLSPSPYYTRIKTDMGERGQVEVVDVDLSSEDNFQLSVHKLNSSYEQLIAQGKSVKGVVLINPHNPLGCVYERQLLTDILDWASRLKLHVIMDEIYAFSVWDESAEFVSVAALENIPDPARTHLVWGFSKDFSLSGFRTGVLYSWNPAVIALVKSLMYFASIPAMIQHKLNCILKDEEWLDNVYFPASQNGLRSAYAVVKAGLDVLGIPFVAPKAGVFVWMDLRKYVKPLCAEAQAKLFEKIFESKVYIEPANAFYSKEVGWFRMCFAFPEYWVAEGLKRLGAILKSVEGKSLIDSDVVTVAVSDTPKAAETAAGDSASLESLLGSLKANIQEADWVAATVSTGKSWADENPGAAEEFRRALEALDKDSGVQK